MANPSEGGPGPELGPLLEAHRAYLRRIALAELGGDLQAKLSASDVVQDTFLEAQRDLAQFRGAGAAELRAWLRGILVHNLHNLHRRYRATDRRRLDRERSLDDPAQTPPEVAADQTSPSTAAARAEFHDALREAVGRLPAHYRRVIELRVRGKLTYEEIGREVGLSAEAARKVWARALALLHGDLRPLLGG